MTQDALPRWLRTTFIAISDAPFTNIKSANGEILTYATFGLIALAEIFAVPLREWLIYAWLGFLAGKVGFAMAGAGWKRETYKPSPPASQDIEDVAATTPTPPPEKVLTKADAEAAAGAIEQRNKQLSEEQEGA